jgi:hypothetical protein
MSEFWGFYATPSGADFDRAKLKATLKKLKADALVHHAGAWLYVVTPLQHKIEKFADTVLSFFDHESAAWDFSVYLKGKRIGGGTFGENAETGADDEGFDGDLAASAKALGTTAKKLEATFVEDSAKFLKLLGLSLLPVGPGDVEKGIRFLDEDD